MNIGHSKFFACLHVIAAMVFMLVGVYTVAFSPTPDVSCMIDATDGDDYSPPNEFIDNTGDVR